VKKLKVVLINVGREYKNNLASPPIGLMSLASWARTHMDGLEFRILDQRLERCDYDTITDMALAEEADVVGLTYMTGASPFVPRMTQRLRAARPETAIFLGGPHVSADEAVAIEGTAADAAVIGEGERSFEQMLRVLQDGSRDFSEIPGLVWRDGSGETICNPGHGPLVDDLDTLPFLAYDLLDMPRYWKMFHQSLIPPPRKYLVMFSSRGCPYRCIYCHHVFGKSFRAQSAQRLVDEMEHLQKTYGVTQFDFMDDIFNLDKQRVFDTAAEVTRRNLRFQITMANGVRTDILTPEVVDAMVEMGLFASGFALESGCSRIQKLAKKNLNIPKFLKGVEMMARKRVFTYGFTMFGFPTETGEEMQMTIDTAANSWLHAAIFLKVTPYPNTELYDVAKELYPERMRELDYSNHEFIYSPVVNLSAVSDDELLYYVRKATRTFYLRPGRMMRLFRDYPKPLRLSRYAAGVAVQSFSKKAIGYKSWQTRLETLGPERFTP
jgi:anaerobic magnesium-protoporphyrin IX monomethyl ester cyclase